MPEKKAVLTKRMSKKRAETEGKYGKWNGGAERDAWNVQQNEGEMKRHDN